MNIGELFVNLGVKGSEKTLGALTNVKQGLSESKSMATETKVALVGALYAFEKYMAASAKVGSNLTNFNAVTGISVQELQKWQYAARQAGISGDEMAGSMKSVQTTMANMLLGKGQPEGLGLMSRAVGFDPSKARDTLYVLQKIAEFSKKASPEIANMVANSFGVSEGVAAAMRRNKFTPEVMAKAPTFSNKEVGQLDRVNAAWGNLGQKVDMAFGHFNSKHGAQLVSDLSKIVDLVLKLASAFTVLAEKIHIFDAIGKALGGLSLIIEGISGAAEAVQGDKEGPLAGLKKLGGNIIEGGALAWKGIQLTEQDNMQKLIAPQYGPPAQGSGSKVEINQTLQFQHDGKDHSKVSQTHKHAAAQAYRQSPALKGGQ